MITGADDILPGVAASLVAGNHLVQGQRILLFTAVLADETVAAEYLYTG